MKTNEPLQSAPVQYTETEVRSFLPTGWDLLTDRKDSGWDAKKKVWRATVIDNVDFDYPLEVKAADAGKDRLDALRKAMDRLYRERLG
jgi:hypothetical protein